jgi:hypothetical protein
VAAGSRASATRFRFWGPPGSGPQRVSPAFPKPCNQGELPLWGAPAAIRMARPARRTQPGERGNGLVEERRRAKVLSIDRPGHDFDGWRCHVAFRVSRRRSARGARVGTRFRSCGGHITDAPAAPGPGKSAPGRTDRHDGKSQHNQYLLHSLHLRSGDRKDPTRIPYQRNCGLINPTPRRLMCKCNAHFFPNLRSPPQPPYPARSPDWTDAK